MIRSVISVSLVSGGFQLHWQLLCRRMSSGDKRDGQEERQDGPRDIFSLFGPEVKPSADKRPKTRTKSSRSRSPAGPPQKSRQRFLLYSLNYSTKLSSQWRRSSHVDDTQSASTDSTEVSGTGEKVENRREKLFIIDMMKGGGDDSKPSDQKVMSC